MSRRRVVTKRVIESDPIYGTVDVAKFINHIMLDGKKTVAMGIVYGAFESIKEKTGRDPLEIFERALAHVMPKVEVKSRRVGGATYQVPVEVSEARAKTLAMRWLIAAARARSEREMFAALAAELMDAADEEDGSQGRGGAVKKREDTHRMAEANKAFSHFRW